MEYHSAYVNSIYFVWTLCIKLSVTSQEFEISSINRAKISNKKPNRPTIKKKKKEFFISRVFLEYFSSVYGRNFKFLS